MSAGRSSSRSSSVVVASPIRRLITPERLRGLLVSAGPTYVRLGQHLALRPDVIPQEHHDALLELVDEVPSFAWETVRRIVEEDLGQPPERLFAVVDPTPLAAGSVAQVHRARLEEGREVVLKVQRPGSRERIERDLRRARWLAPLLDQGVPSTLPAGELLREIEAWMLEEVDFDRQLENLVRLHRDNASTRGLRVPRPHPELSGPRVVTMEHLRGLPLAELLGTPPETWGPKLEEHLGSTTTAPEEELPETPLDADTPFDPEALASRLLRTLMEQAFRRGFFHANPHPGNLLACGDGTLGLVDAGLCRELEPRLQRQQLKYFSAFYSGDSHQLHQALSELLLAGSGTDPESFRRELRQEAESWQSGHGPDGRASLAQAMTEGTRLARRHQLQMPVHLLTGYRTLLTAERVAAALGSEASLDTAGRRVLADLQHDRLFELVDRESVERFLLTAAELLREAPDQVGQLLKEISEGSFLLQVSETESQRSERLWNRRVRLLSTALLSVGLCILLAGGPWPPLLGVPTESLLALALGWLCLSLLWQWTRLR